MNKEDPLLLLSTTVQVEAKDVEEAKDKVRIAMADSGVWKNFWRNLHSLLRSNGHSPKWQPEDCQLPIEIKKE